jgi:hypothetical protein
MESRPANPDSHTAQTAQTATARLRAIKRELAKQHRPKGQRIDEAVRRIEALADDIEAGVEGNEGGADA